MTTSNREILLAEYAQVGNNFRLLTDIRFKLLAFLPVAAGAAAAVVSAIGGATVPAVAFSFFGLTVTVGLVTYNVRNDQLYDTLVARAAALERRLGDPDGAFANRPRPWLSMQFGRARWPVNHRFGIGAIYLASIGLWVFGVLNSASLLVHTRLVGGEVPVYLDVTLLVASITGTIAAGLLVRRRHNKIQEDLRITAADVVSRIASRTGSDTPGVLGDEELIRLLAKLAGTRLEEMRGRVRYLTNLTPPEMTFYIRPNSATWGAAQTVACLADFAPEWLYDCAMRRRSEIPQVSDWSPEDVELVLTTVEQQRRGEQMSQTVRTALAGDGRIGREQIEDNRALMLRKSTKALDRAISRIVERLNRERMFPNGVRPPLMRPEGQYLQIPSELVEAWKARQSFGLEPIA